MDEKIKHKLAGVVEEYKKYFPDEYELVTRMVRDNREELQSDFADLDGMKEVKRAMLELPETLHNMITNELTQEELMHWKQSRKLLVWFAKKFREFAIPTRI